MLSPPVLSRIEERHHETGRGVDSGQVGAFLEIAVPACERQVVEPRQSTMLSSNDVLNVKGAPKRRLRQMAILAKIRGAPPDFSGILAHAWGKKARRAFDCQ